MIPRGRLDCCWQRLLLYEFQPLQKGSSWWRNKDKNCSGGAGAVGIRPWVELRSGCWQLQRSQCAAVGLEILLPAKTASNSWSHAPSPPPTSAPFLAGDHLKGEFKMTQCLWGKELWLLQTEPPETFRKLKKERKSEMFCVCWMACLECGGCRVMRLEPLGILQCYLLALAHQVRMPSSRVKTGWRDKGNERKQIHCETLGSESDSLFPQKRETGLLPHCKRVIKTSLRAPQMAKAHS